MGDRASIQQGVLTVLVGGSAAAAPAAQAAVGRLLARYTDKQQLVGGLGAGTAAKLALNMLHMSLDVLLAECLTLGVKAVRPAIIEFHFIPSLNRFLDIPTFQYKNSTPTPMRARHPDANTGTTRRSSLPRTRCRCDCHCACWCLRASACPVVTAALPCLCHGLS